MNPEPRELTQDVLDFLLHHNFIWLGMDGQLNEWLFENNGKIYDLSAADILQIETIKKNGLFLVEK